MWRLDRLLHGENMKFGNFLKMISREDKALADEVFEEVSSLFIEFYPNTGIGEILGMRIRDIDFRIKMIVKRAQVNAKDLLSKLEGLENTSLMEGPWDGVAINSDWKGAWRKDNR